MTSIFSDLFSTVAQFQQIVTLKDIDDDQFEDLVIQTGNKVILYRGQPDGINDEVDQVATTKPKRHCRGASRL